MNFFFRPHRAVSLFFSFLVFRSDLIDVPGLEVTWELCTMRKARSSRHQWFNTKSKVNLLRWLVCLAVQVAHHGFSWIILFVFLFSQLSLLAAAVLPCLPFQFPPYSWTYTLQQNLLKGDDTLFNARIEMHLDYIQTQSVSSHIKE